MNVYIYQSIFFLEVVLEFSSNIIRLKWGKSGKEDETDLLRLQGLANLQVNILKLQEVFMTIAPRLYI